MRFVPDVLSILILVFLKGLAPAQEPPRLELFLPTGHTARVASVALSGDGKLVATGSWDRPAMLWSAATMRLKEIGEPALDALHKVETSSDPEVRRRASRGRTCAARCQGRKFQQSSCLAPRPRPDRASFLGGSTDGLVHRRPQRHQYREG